MNTPIKRRGRPPLSGNTGHGGVRYQIAIPEEIAERLRAHGDGSLSLGIIRAGQRLRKLKS